MGRIEIDDLVEVTSLLSGYGAALVVLNAFTERHLRIEGDRCCCVSSYDSPRKTLSEALDRARVTAYQNPRGLRYPRASGFGMLESGVNIHLMGSCGHDTCPCSLLLVVRALAIEVSRRVA